jgi:hypothetical protein
MAYRFNGTTDKVEFAITPLSGYTFGPATLACLFKRTTAGTDDFMIWLTDSNGTTNRVGCYVDSSNAPEAFLNGSQSGSGGTFASTTAWYIFVTTWSAAATTPRFHVWNGSSWAHANASGAIGAAFTVAGTSRIAFGARPTVANPFVGDAVCCGIKKADSSDAAVQALNATAWSSWTGFGFDWLIGFDSSLVSGGVLQDQSLAGTGDEISKVGTTLVSDPPGWSWVASTINSNFLAFA